MQNIYKTRQAEWNVTVFIWNITQCTCKYFEDWTCTQNYHAIYKSVFIEIFYLQEHYLCIKKLEW